MSNRLTGQVYLLTASANNKQNWAAGQSVGKWSVLGAQQLIWALYKASVMTQYGYKCSQLGQSNGQLSELL